MIIEQESPGVGFDQAHYHIESRGLAGTIGAQETDYATGLKCQRDLVDDPPPLITLDHFADDQTVTHLNPKPPR